MENDYVTLVMVFWNLKSYPYISRKYMENDYVTLVMGFWNLKSYPSKIDLKILF